MANFDLLIIEASGDSLHIVADAIDASDPRDFSTDFLAGFFRACASLYPGKRRRGEHIAGSRYFIKRLIGHLNVESIESLLDDLTLDLACRCGKEPYECECRTGVSKVIGSMLDRYFELTDLPADLGRVWQWIGNLRFFEEKTASQSRSVEILQRDSALRQGIISYVLGELTDRDQILHLRSEKFQWHCHSGLHLSADDIKFIADLAFDRNNSKLWATSITWHQIRRVAEEQNSDPLRHHLRKQAREKPAFLREWYLSQRGAKESQQKHRAYPYLRNRRMARFRKKQDDIRVANIEYVLNNRELVESGRHWDCLVRFAHLLLMEPDKIESEFGDETLVRTALRNSIAFVAPYVPDLLKLAELQCASQSTQAETILYAACLEILRAKGNLEEIGFGLLRSLRTNLNMHFSAVSGEEVKALKAEVERLIFPDEVSSEIFLRDYVEPQLGLPGCSRPDVWLLQSDSAFKHLRAKLSIEWLNRFPDIVLGSLDILFEIAAQHGDRQELKLLIEERCAELNSRADDGIEDLNQRRQFWFLRAWYFLTNMPDAYWMQLTADKDSIHLLYDRSSRMRRSDHPSWPPLTARKAAAVLDAFIERWPKVDLPDHWGTGSPKGENAYRFLVEVIWSIGADDPDNAIPVLGLLLGDSRFADLQQDMKGILAAQIRKKFLRDFEPPAPQEVVDRIDHNIVVTVEGLRQLVLEELLDFQKAIDGGEFDSADRFYEKGDRLGEVACTKIIAERLNLKLQPQNITVTPEHQLKAATRSDFTVTKLIAGKRRLLVTEVKGQWHKDLYTAASAQLHEHYSIHPDAEQQGIFLVIWFGGDEVIAGRKTPEIVSSSELRLSIEATLPLDLKGLIDVFVLDVSRSI